jgi:hypothetical protein
MATRSSCLTLSLCRVARQAQHTRRRRMNGLDGVLPRAQENDCVAASGRGSRYRSCLCAGGESFSRPTGRPGLLDGQPPFFGHDFGDSPGEGVGEGPPAALGTTGTPMTRTCPTTRPMTTARTADWLCILRREIGQARLMKSRCGSLLFVSELSVPIH